MANFDASLCLLLLRQIPIFRWCFSCLSPGGHDFCSAVHTPCQLRASSFNTHFTQEDLSFKNVSSSPVSLQTQAHKLLSHCQTHVDKVCRNVICKYIFHIPYWWYKICAKEPTSYFLSVQVRVQLILKLLDLLIHSLIQQILIDCLICACLMLSATPIILFSHMRVLIRFHFHYLTYIYFMEYFSTPSFSSNFYLSFLG